MSFRETIFTEPLWDPGSTLMSYVTKSKCSTQRLRETERAGELAQPLKARLTRENVRDKELQGHLLSADETGLGVQKWLGAVFP